MRYPLITLNRHACRVVLMEGDGVSAVEHPLHGLVARRFGSHGQALAYLSFWRGDSTAMADLRWALQRSGTLPAGPRGQGPDELLSALADQLQRGVLQLFESSLQRTPPGRLAPAPTSVGSALAGLPALDALPAVPVLPPLLPALEEVQIEGAEVMPEVEQSLGEIAATLGTVGQVSASLAPAPDKVPEVQAEMTRSSTALRAQLDAL